jgi:hypothetical protein
MVQPAEGTTSVPAPRFVNPIPAKAITGWEETDDFPHPYECEDHGVDLADGEMDALDNLYPRQGDKLAGWPAWVQHVNYPRCRKCHQWMSFVFQIDSDCNLRYMFGDNGCGHITQCPEHRDELTFVWDCF